MSNEHPFKVVVHDYDPAWPDAFEEERARIQALLGDALIACHHIGSTAVPGLAAKPIIDLLGEAPSLAVIDARQALLVIEGYEALGEFGLVGRRYFRKHDSTGQRTHHLHIFEPGVQEVRRHLAFRNYLRAHPSEAATYGALKEQLAQAHPDDIEAYMDGKDTLVKALEGKALAWQGLNKRS